MKSNYSSMDHHQRRLENDVASVRQGVQQAFGEVRDILLGLTQSLNYTDLHQLVKDIDGFYQQRDKTIKILEEIATVEDTKLGEYKQHLQKIYNFGQDVCRLSGIDMKGLESSPNGQARLNELYATYCERFSQLITPIRVVHDDILATSATKDQRPILEKYIPYIEKMVPEDRPVFIEQITKHLNSGANPLAIEFSFITHIPQNIYREVYPLPENPDEENMLQELRAQLELIKQELANKDTELHAKEVIIEERDQTITDLNAQNTELTNKVTERDGTIDGLNTTINDLNTTVQTLENTIVERDTQIDNLNNTIHDLQEGHVDQSPQINDLTHRLELAIVKKEAAEQQVTLLTRENERLGQSEEELRLDKVELRAANKIVNDEKKQIKDILEGRIEDLNHQKHESKLFIQEVKGHYENHELVMSGCNSCHAYQYPIDWSPFE